VGDAARRRRRVEEAAAGVFRGWGYEEILLPLFDHAEVFARGGGRWSERSSYRFTEGGDLLALRADFTALAARAAVTRLPRETERLFYRGEVVRRPGRGLGPSAYREVGVEHFAAGTAADVEILLVALEVLERLGIAGYVVTLGHAGYPLGLLAEALSGAPDRDERRAEALAGLWRRDPSRVRAALGEGAAPLVEALEFFGGSGVLEEARKRPLPERARQGVSRLDGVFGVLEELEVADRFRVDLAELRGFDYYTGLIFEIHAPGAGQEIGGGGRYDDLLANFGDPRPAVGFSLSVDRLATILPDSPGSSRSPVARVASGPDTRTGLVNRFRAARAARAGGAAIRFVPPR
jgi:ATP phosphoribosyltransferase regulatory subunit